MNKKLPKYQINFILQQLLAFTFVCILAFADYYISYDFKFIKIGIQSFTFIFVVIYEVIVNLLYRRAKKNEEIVDEENDEMGYNERFLWFEIILLLDILIIVALISQRIETNINISIPIVLGFIIFYIITLIIKPYFGIKNKK